MSGNELIVTYATNSTDFWDHGRDPRLYWPRFVRVTIEPAPDQRNGEYSVGLRN